MKFLLSIWYYWQHSSKIETFLVSDITDNIQVKEKRQATLENFDNTDGIQVREPPRNAQNTKLQLQHLLTKYIRMLVENALKIQSW